MGLDVNLHKATLNFLSPQDSAHPNSYHDPNSDPISDLDPKSCTLICSGSSICDCLIVQTCIMYVTEQVSYSIYAEINISASVEQKLEKITVSVFWICCYFIRSEQKASPTPPPWGSLFFHIFYITWIIFWGKKGVWIRSADILIPDPQHWDVFCKEKNTNKHDVTRFFCCQMRIINHTFAFALFRAQPSHVSSLTLRSDTANQWWPSPWAGFSDKEWYFQVKLMWLVCCSLHSDSDKWLNRPSCPGSDVLCFRALQWQCLPSFEDVGHHFIDWCDHIWKHEYEEVHLQYGLSAGLQTPREPGLSVGPTADAGKGWDTSLELHFHSGSCQTLIKWWAGPLHCSHRDSFSRSNFRACSQILQSRGSSLNMARRQIRSVRLWKGHAHLRGEGSSFHSFIHSFI